MEYNLLGRQIKNSVRTAQALAGFRKELINYRLLTEVVDIVGDFSDFEGLCECQKRKFGYYSGGERGNFLQDIKAGYGRDRLV